MSNNKSPHFLYCDKLKDIGEKLGFKTSWKDTKEKELYHLANPDCIWYQEMPERLRGIDGIPDKIPLVVFEVLYSEGEKGMRGSLGSFVIRGGHLGIFVILKPSNESDEKYNGRIKYINNLIGKLGSEHFRLWEANIVDKLADELGIKSE